MYMYIKGTGEITKLPFIGERFYLRQRQTDASQEEPFHATCGFNIKGQHKVKDRNAFFK